MELSSVPTSRAGNGYYYDVYVSSEKCVLSPPLHIFQSVSKQAVCRPLVDMDYIEYLITSSDKKSWKSLNESVHSILVTIPTLLGFALAQMFLNQMPLHSTRRFLLEFLLIVLPTICNNTVATSYSELYCAVCVLLLIVMLWRSGVYQERADVADEVSFEVGKRPMVFTLLRATAYAGTSIAILAIDFKSFPVEYRKSRTFGASVMDMGIGLFVTTMGVVSHRSRNFGDVKKLPKVVMPLLVLGLARTVVISLIDYHQDEHEYGKHLNAFFTLGLTKLLGGIVSLLARSDEQLLPLALGILLLHETVLQLGLSEYVMSNDSRNGFLSANREGLSALPGCVALYLLSIYFAKWYISQDQLNYKQFRTKLRNMLLFAIFGWLFVFGSTFCVGIARVTFNTGYVIWLFSIFVTFLLLYSFLFEFALKLPKAEPVLIGENVEDAESVEDSNPVESQTEPSTLPVFVQALNMNGLTQFMLSNFLTGFVNLTLEPGKRDSVECVLILTLYMLASVGVVYVLFRKGIRIA